MSRMMAVSFTPFIRHRFLSVRDSTYIMQSTFELSFPFFLMPSPCFVLFRPEGFKAQFVLLETVFVLLLVFAVPGGAHTTVVAVSIANLFAVAWFWYNFVRSVEVTSDGNLRFWIGNIEVDVPFDKIVSIRRIAGTTFPTNCFPSIMPYRGFLSNPMDGVSIITTVPSTPFWLWPRSAGKPERSFFFGLIMCPKLTIVFSPSGGGHAFVTDVENEMRNFSNGNGRGNRSGNSGLTPRTNNPDFLDV